MRALALGSMMLPALVLACTGGSATDDTVRAPLSAPALRPASIGSAPTATKHVRLGTRGSVSVTVDGSSYIGSHEVGHAALSTVDEYVESGFDDLQRSHNPAHGRAGEVELGGKLRSSKELLAWRRDAAAGTALPKDVEVTVFDGDRHEAVRITYAGALPKIARPGKASQGRGERFTLTYASERWQPIAGSTLSGMSLQVSAHAKGDFEVLQSAGGRACRASIIGPEIIGPELNGIIGPERVGIIGPEIVQGPNNVPAPQQPTAASSPKITLAVDAVAAKWFDGLVGQLADVTLQSSSSQQQVPVQVNLRGVFGASHSLTPLNGGTEDECTEEVNIDVGDAGFLG